MAYQRCCNFIISAYDGVLLNLLAKIPAWGKNPTREYEFYNGSVPSKLAIFTGYGKSYKDMFTYHLINIKADDKIFTLNINFESSSGSQDGYNNLLESEGYLMDLPDDTIYVM